MNQQEMMNDSDFDGIWAQTLEEFEPDPFDEIKEFGRYIEEQRKEKNWSQTQ